MFIESDDEFVVDPDTLDSVSPEIVAEARRRLVEDIDAQFDMSFITGGANVRSRNFYDDGNYRIKLVD